MKEIWVLQHTEAEYLGLIEDHLEGRNLRFRYLRPFAPNGLVPEGPGKAAGLIVLGGGPYGVVSGHLLPSLGPELRLVKAFLAEGLPVVGFGIGALLLCVASGGGVAEAPLRFAVTDVTATDALPDAPRGPFPLAAYLRDLPLPTPDMPILFLDDAGAAWGFSVNGNSMGMVGHPGMKRGMAEDLIMEFAETPEDTLTGLDRLAAQQLAIAEALGPLMVAITRHCGWM